MAKRRMKLIFLFFILFSLSSFAEDISFGERGFDIEHTAPVSKSDMASATILLPKKIEGQSLVSYTALIFKGNEIEFQPHEGSLTQLSDCARHNYVGECVTRSDSTYRFVVSVAEARLKDIGLGVVYSSPGGKDRLVYLVRQ